jgi:hypothetical protein
MNFNESFQYILFDTEKGKTWQCDVTDRVFLQFADTTVSFKILDFFTFCRKVNSVNILNMLYNLSDESDCELIETSQGSFSKKLTIYEIVQLRELLDGTKFALSLNSMLHEIEVTSFSASNSVFA